MAGELQGWRKNILEQLEKRRNIELGPYKELVDSRKFFERNM